MFGNTAVVDKKERLESVVEEIHRRFGKNSILPATISRSLPKLPTDREIEIRMPTGMLSYAYKTDLIQSNPADKVELPKIEKYCRPNRRCPRQG